jgi:hypothetical protein
MSQAITRADEDLLSRAAGLPIGPCPSCEREVVAYPLDADRATTAYACVHCDGPVRRVEWIDESALGELGYSVEDPLAGGCATGCARGGCGARGTRAS